MNNEVTILTVTKRTGWFNKAVEQYNKQRVFKQEVLPRWLVVYEPNCKPRFNSGAEWVKAPPKFRASNLNASLNHGLGLVTTPYVIFYQDFIDLPPNCFRGLLSAAKKTDGFVTTATINPDGQHDARYLGVNLLRECLPEEWEANVAIAPMKVIKELGGFDEAYDDGWSWDNCFDGDTEFLSVGKGAVRFRDSVGETHKVLTPNGVFEGIVKEYGVQSLFEYTFEPVRWGTLPSGWGGWQKTKAQDIKVSATLRHRWELVDGTITQDLSVGDVVPAVYAGKEPTDAEGFVHGLIYGDGTQDRRYSNGDYRYRMRLCGDKKKYVKYFDNVTYPPFANGDATIWLRSSFGGYKKPPTKDKSIAYIQSFFDGLVATDGRVVNNTVKISSAKREIIDWIVEYAPLLGVNVRSVRELQRGDTAYPSKNTTYWLIMLVTSEAKTAWRVATQLHENRKDRVYCLEVPGEHRFTLANGLLTGNCNLAERAAMLGYKFYIDESIKPQLRHHVKEPDANPSLQLNGGFHQMIMAQIRAGEYPLQLPYL